MNTQPLGDSPLLSTRISYGCWRAAGSEDPRQVTPDTMARGRRAISAAYEAGYTLFDNADIYCHGICESIFGDALSDNPGMRDRILIATKCGIRFPGQPNADSPQRYDFSAEHILWSAEQSLRRMKIETFDLYQLHRPDVLMDPTEVAGAFDKLRRHGKAKEFGVSNFSTSQVETLAQFCPMPLIVNQVEIHLGRLDCFHDGTLDQCLRKNMTPLAWSPLGGGSLMSANGSKNVLTQTLDDTASRYGVSRAVIALAWLMKHPSHILPIIGSTNIDRIRDAVKADSVELTREDWYRLLIAARGEPLP